MENQNDELDPQADLALLERARASVEFDQALDFGPWWYAPLAAAAIAAATLFSQDGSSGMLGLVMIACLMLAAHDRHRRPVRPRPSARSAMLIVPFGLGTFVLIGLWGTAVSSIGYDDFVPGWALLGWILTTALFLGIRAILSLVRDRRAPIQ
ncbi:MAG: hypothetical protein HKN24_01210 [Acidimicrobiales bacterium]|nr:hypothetical protein [Acidimicrobiales bacterium]